MGGGLRAGGGGWGAPMSILLGAPKFLQTALDTPLGPRIHWMFQMKATRGSNPTNINKRSTGQINTRAAAAKSSRTKQTRVKHPRAVLLPLHLQSASHGSQKIGQPESLKSSSVQGNFQVVNLSSCELSVDQISVLELGLSFCPTQNIDAFELIKDINLFSRKLMLKILFYKPKTNFDNPLWQQMSLDDIKAVEELMELWEEGHINDDDLSLAELLETDSVPPAPAALGPQHNAPSITSTKRDYKPKSRMFPTLQGNPNVWAFTSQVTKEIS